MEIGWSLENKGNRNRFLHLETILLLTLRLHALGRAAQRRGRSGEWCIRPAPFFASPSPTGEDRGTARPHRGPWTGSSTMVDGVTSLAEQCHYGECFGTVL